jgi:saccharopine dehydrogenase-like NADP-dependent oxidoreductase
MSLPGVLVVGATGVFGSRLAEALVRGGFCRVVLAGRRAAALADAARDLRSRFPAAEVATAVLDRRAVDASALLALEVALVIDAAGPFQAEEPHLARAAISAGIATLDLADARDFVERYSGLDREARRMGVVALTGLSSTPALSNAALDAITSGWQAVDHVEVAITPGNRAPRGLAVVKAILSYAGHPTMVWLGGSWQARRGWGLLGRVHLPGLGRRWVSLCETPDLDILPRRFPSATTALFRAGLELSVLHLGLWVLSLPVRFGLVKSLRPLARVLIEIARWLEPLGGDRGGMIVIARGRDRDGIAVEASWALEAVDGSGPEIPAVPAAAVARLLLAGAPVPPGARAAIGVLPLHAYEREFKGRPIVTRRRTLRIAPAPPRGGLLEQALGGEFLALPPLLRQVHKGNFAVLRGIGSVEGSSWRPIRWLARRIGLPSPGRDLPVTVEITPVQGGERWSRAFSTGCFCSLLKPSGSPGVIREQVGPFGIEMAAWRRSSGFDLVSECVRIGPVRLPSWLAPRARGGSWLDEDGRYTFDVEASLPLLGRIMRYHGWLQPVEPPGEDDPGTVDQRCRVANPG